MGSSRPGLARAVVILMAAAGGLASAPAAGDWLVTTDGAAVETRGGWQVKGSLVLFYTPDGTFSSLRLDAVDLEASTARTEVARSAKRTRPEPAPAPARKARLVLTDDDVAHVDPATLANAAAGSDGETGASEAAAGELTAAADNPLEVINWDAVVGAQSDGVTITGVVSNPSDLHAMDIKIQVTILDLAGVVIEDRQASMPVTALGPGDQGAFQAFFPGVFGVGNALFEITSFNAVVPKGPREPEGPEAEEPGV